MNDTLPKPPIRRPQRYGRYQRHLRRDNATFAILTHIPKWLHDLLPLNNQRTVLTAAAIRGSQPLLRHHIKWGQVAVHSPKTATLMRLLFTEEEINALADFGHSIGVTTNSGILRTAIMNGLNLKAARKGDPSPSRKYPFIRREWLALLRATGLPLGGIGESKKGDKTKGKQHKGKEIGHNPILLTTLAVKAKYPDLNRRSHYGRTCPEGSLNMKQIVIRQRTKTRREDQARDLLLQKELETSRSLKEQRILRRLGASIHA